MKSPFAHPKLVVSVRFNAEVRLVNIWMVAATNFYVLQICFHVRVKHVEVVVQADQLPGGFSKPVL